MDIGTAKPDCRRMRRACAHHLIDIRDPGGELFGGRIHARCRAGDARHLGARASTAAGRRHHAVFPCADAMALRDLPEADPGVRAGIDAQAAEAGLAGAASRTRRGRSGGRGAHSCQRSATHPARARSVPVDRAEHHESAASARCRCSPTSTCTEFALAPLERARFTHQDRNALRGNARRRTSGGGASAFTKEAI